MLLRFVRRVCAAVLTLVLLMIVGLIGMFAVEALNPLGVLAQH